MTDKMVAFCGICCTDCPAYIATQKDDEVEKRKVAEQWSKFSPEKPPLKPEEVECDGCFSISGRLFNYCKECQIRKCGLEKGVKNCAYCDEYLCDKLEKFFTQFPDVKKNLEEIRRSL
ncbi:MAG: hypothetical protein AMJ90_01910 [candidate division Zixibacteria bacterium SM23_73_2]|nr:MAG: hypothetical protein AMJ90_01910 [candidate division Zixibacteria bacterium SM23_73_2]